MKRGGKSFDTRGRGNLLILLITGAAAFFIANYALPRAFSVVSVNPSLASADRGQNATAEAPAAHATTAASVAHLATPPQVKAIYMTACIASGKSMRKRLVDLVETTELNSIVLDIKDYSGTISFPTGNPLLAEGAGSPCLVRDMKGFVAELHAKGIYVIGRVTVFQDPKYTKLHPDAAVKRAKDGTTWRDRKGLAFVDVGSKEYWDYVIALAKESYGLGFDEINFDYIRFPSDGDMEDARFSRSVALGKTKPEALREFFAYLDSGLSGTGIVTSADLFGMVTTSSNDMGIGQVLEDALPYFDYIAPMVYPSHYPDGFNGWKNVNSSAVVGPLIEFVMGTAVERVNAFRDETASSTPGSSLLSRVKTAQLRPWLQDNDYPVPYTAEMVRAQIQGTYDAGLDSWMLWDAGNTYTRSALEPDN